MQQTEFSSLRLKTGMSINDLAAELDYTSRQLYRWENGEATPRAPVLEKLHNLAGRRAEHTPANGHFTFIDLFAGIGGLRKAFSPIGGHCVFTSEWDKYAQQTYAANFRDNRPIEGDIRAIETGDIPDHDVLLAGFPCQPFSIAGVSKKNALGRKHGFACETQGTLFFDVARIIKDKRPAAFLLENVKNLKSHDKGRTFKVIMKTLQEELGYHVWEQVIDARHFLPQHRQRIVIVGFRENVPFSWDDLNLPEKGRKAISRSALWLRSMRNIRSHPNSGPICKTMPKSIKPKAMASGSVWSRRTRHAAPCRRDITKTVRKSLSVAGRIKFRAA